MLLYIAFMSLVGAISTAYGASPKRFWETLTVIFTTGAPILGLIAFIFSLLEEKSKVLKRLDRAVTLLTLTAGLIAGFGLIEFTHFSRVDEQASAQRILDLTKEVGDADGIAKTANQQLIDQKVTLIDQGQKVLATDKQIKVVSVEADHAVAKLNAEIADANRRAGIETLIGRMNSDDATAYDQLASMKAFGNSEQEARVHQAVEAMIDEHNNPSYNGHNFQSFRGYFPATLPEMPERLRSKSAFFREEALKDLGKYQVQPDLLPTIIELASHDPSLGVRTLAVRLIDGWGTERFQPFRFDIEGWWKKSYLFNHPAPTAQKPQ